MIFHLVFRSRSTDEETEPDVIPPGLGEGQSLEDVQEDPESGDSETATEVEVSEKTLKFKISTESTITTTGRKSYPGSRKGSRERVQHLNHSDIAKMMQKGKLRVGGFSFDQHCMVGNKKLSFDTPEFLHEYSPILKKKYEEMPPSKSDSDEENASKDDDECVISKETLNLNKRNSEHSVKVPVSVEEKRSILKSSDVTIYSNADKLKLNNSLLFKERIESKPSNDDEGPVCPNNTRQNSIKNCIDQTINDTKSDSVNSILIQKDELSSESKNSSRSIFSRFRQFTDRFGLSVDKEAKTKNSKSTSVKNNNCSKGTLHKGKKKLESSCCKSLDEVEVRKASTLPKTKNKKTWKFLGKDKEAWISDAAVDKFSTDNQSLPSTSNCPSPSFRGGSTAPTSPRKVATIDGNSLGNNVVDKCIVKLQEIQQEESLIVNDQDRNPI